MPTSVVRHRRQSGGARQPTIGACLNHCFSKNLLADNRAILHIAGKDVPVRTRHVTDPTEARSMHAPVKQKYDAETISGGMSMVASTGGVTLLPLYVKNILIPSVVARPLQGEPPTIDLMLGYNKSNTSPVLKRFLSRADELVVGVSQKQRFLPVR